MEPRAKIEPQNTKSKFRSRHYYLLMVLFATYFDSASFNSVQFSWVQFNFGHVFKRHFLHFISSSPIVLFIYVNSAVELNEQCKFCICIDANVESTSCTMCDTTEGAAAICIFLPSSLCFCQFKPILKLVQIQQSNVPVTVASASIHSFIRSAQ